MINSAVTVNVNYKQDNNYTIEGGIIQHGGICKDEDTKDIDSVIPGEDTNFLVYSQSWTGGTKWYLNMLLINGQVINLPPISDEGEISTEEVTTDLVVNGENVHVSIQLEDIGVGLPAIDDEYTWVTGWNKKRTIYVLKIDKVLDDLTIDLNCKLDTQREMMITLNNDGEGFKNIGVSLETDESGGILFWKTEHYEYSIQLNNDNAYAAYYHDDNKSPAYNIYFYSVKPGFDPSSFKISSLAYDGIPVSDTDGGINIETATDLLGRLQKNTKSDIYGFADLIDQAKNYDYGFTLQQNKAMSQSMTWSVDAYNYSVYCELGDGGYFSDSEEEEEYMYDAENKKLTSKGTFSVIENNGVFRLPIHIPQKDNCIFAGWKIVSNDSSSDGEVYGSNDVFHLDDNNIEKYAQGEDTHTPYFKFVAQWVEKDETEGKTQPYTISFYKEIVGQDGSLDYELYKTQTSLAPVNSTIRVLRYSEPDGDYEIDDDKSIQSLTVENNQSNALKVYYKFKRYTVTIQRKDTGYSDGTVPREITINLTASNNKNYIGYIGNLNFENGSVKTELTNDSIVLCVPSGFNLSLNADISDSTEYTVKYRTNNADSDEPFSSVIQNDQIITIIYDRQISIPTGISDKSGNMFWAIATAAIGCIFVVLLNVKKKYVKRE